VINAIILLTHLLLVGGCTLYAFRKGSIALSGWICLQAVLANLFVLKQMDLFGYAVTCSDAFAIGMLFGLNLLREYIGKKEAAQAMRASFLLMAFFVIFSQIHLLYAPHSFDATHFLYALLLNPAPRLLLASLATFYIVQRFDLFLFGAIQKLPLPFSLRNMGSTAISQAVDTVLFSCLGLYGIVPCLTSIITLSLIIKWGIICLMGPLLHLAKRMRPYEV
jgi:uncharacterized integral membrane protein (TIGR00697 family)